MSSTNFFFLPLEVNQVRIKGEEREEGKQLIYTSP